MREGTKKLDGIKPDPKTPKPNIKPTPRPPVGRMIFMPIPPVGRIIVEGPFHGKKEQRLNDALFLKGLATYFEDNCNFPKEVERLREIVGRLEK